MRTEIWRTPIHKGETYDKYQVSNLGRMINLNYRRTGKAKLMEPYEKGRKYLQVYLSKNGKKDWIYVHQLVAETFLPNPLNKPCINHKIEGDEGKKINMVFFNEDGSIDEERSTIEWVTYEENNNYGTVRERISDAQKTTQINQNQYFNYHFRENSLENGHQQRRLKETDLINVIFVNVATENRKPTKDLSLCINKRKRVV